MEIQTTKTVRTHIYNIVARKIKEKLIIILQTDHGTFSNYAKFWEKISENLDIKSLTPRDLVEIEYSVYIGRFREYYNFLSIKRISDKTK